MRFFVVQFAAILALLLIAISASMPVGPARPRTLNQRRPRSTNMAIRSLPAFAPG